LIFTIKLPTKVLITLEFPKCKAIMKIIIILILLIPSISNFALDKLTLNKKIINYHQGLIYIRNGNATLLREVNYDDLIKFSEHIRINAESSKKTYVDVLLGEDPHKWRKNVVKAVLAGISNPDPRVRLYCIHLMLKLSPKRDWFINDIQRILDPQSDDRETVNTYYYYIDIYGRVKLENLKKSLTQLLELGPKIIFLTPKPNSFTYDTKFFTFEWASVYGAEKYDFYLDDNLYYSGKKTLIYVQRKLSFESHRWLVVAKDHYNRIITSNETYFYIKKLESITLKVDTHYNNSRPKFKWQSVDGVRYYELYFYKNNEKVKNLAYRGKNKYYQFAKYLPDGNYTFFVVAKSLFQESVSQELSIKISYINGKNVIKVISKHDAKPRKKSDKDSKKPDEKDKIPVKEDELDFNIEDFKDIEED